jgi:hypothetical protein
MSSNIAFVYSSVNKKGGWCPSWQYSVEHPRAPLSSPAPLREVLPVPSLLFLLWPSSTIPRIRLYGSSSKSPPLRRSLRFPVRLEDNTSLVRLSPPVLPTSSTPGYASSSRQDYYCCCIYTCSSSVDTVYKQQRETRITDKKYEKTSSESLWGGIWCQWIDLIDSFWKMQAFTFYNPTVYPWDDFEVTVWVPFLIISNRDFNWL